MPNDRIKSAIASGMGTNNSGDYVAMRYEGYGPGGVAIIIEALTDNKNRTASELRTAFGKGGGNLGETNSVSFMFERLGQIIYPASKGSADAMFEASVEAGATDCQSSSESHEIVCAVEDFAAVRDTLEEKFGTAEKAGLVWKPNVMAAVNEEQAGDVLKLIEVLEDNDDVQNVFTNFEVSDEVMERLLAAG
jgi:YebC/PmpR family DNA-binding regulatory protein